MKNQKFPPGWNEERVRRVIAHYDRLSDEELAAEDEAAFHLKGHTTMVVPNELVLAIGALIARHQAKSKKAPTHRRQRAASRVARTRRR